MQALRYELIPDSTKASGKETGGKETGGKDKNMDEEELSNIIADSNESALG